MTYNEIWHYLTPPYDENEAKAIARLVLEDAFGLTPTDVYAGKVNDLSPDKEHLLMEFIKRLRRSEPVQYVLEQAYFASRMFKVVPGVLIPRPETAELCGWITTDNNEKKRVLDIGTGSGCIAVTLALEMKDCEVEAWDISETAITTAKANANRHGARVNIHRKDMLKAKPENEKWDIIVSNPPYIARKERQTMEANVKEYEPEEALFVPDENPLLFYKAIADYASKALKRDGKLYLEINPLYVEDMKTMLSTFGFGTPEVRKDQFGKQRMIKATLA